MALNIKTREVGLEESINRTRNKINRSGLSIKLRASDYTQPLGRITQRADEFTKSLEASNARVIAFGASAAIIGGVTRGFVELVTQATKFEKLLTDINVVLGTSQANLERFGKDLYEVARNTSQGLDVAAEAALEFSRQGLSMEETLKRTNDALILTRLTGIDAASAVSGLTAAVNGFADAGLSTTSIINKLAAVDVEFAVSAEDLINALARAGAVAQDAGVNFDQLVGAVTSAQQITARGGAVIGNSFKTIFTRVQRSSTLNRLEELGVAVRDLYGNTLPAISVLQNLSNTYEDLADTTKAAVAEQVGGVFQINILKAALKDLNKENSLYAKATEISSNATDQAQQKNALLQQTISSLAKQTSLSISELAANIGELALAPGISNILDALNSTAGALNDLFGADSEGLGSDFAKGLVKGIGNVLTGPGLVLAFGVFGKLFFNALKFAKSSLKDILGIVSAKDKERKIQEAILQAMSNNKNIYSSLKKLSNDKYQQEELILNSIKLQTREMLSQQKIARDLAPLLVTRGVTPNLTLPKNKLNSHSGFIPNYSNVSKEDRKRETSGAIKSGYSPGSIQEMKIPGIGSVVYNNAETVKVFPGMQQPAIMPPERSKAGKDYEKNFKEKHGFNPYAHNGLVPNYAPNWSKVEEISKGGRGITKGEQAAAQNKLNQRNKNRPIKNVRLPNNGTKDFISIYLKQPNAYSYEEDSLHLDRLRKVNKYPEDKLKEISEARKHYQKYGKDSVTLNDIPVNNKGFIPNFANEKDAFLLPGTNILRLPQSNMEVETSVADYKGNKKTGLHKLEAPVSSVAGFLISQKDEMSKLQEMGVNVLTRDVVFSNYDPQRSTRKESKSSPKGVTEKFSKTKSKKTKKTPTRKQVGGKYEEELYDQSLKDLGYSPTADQSKVDFVGPNLKPIETKFNKIVQANLIAKSIRLYSDQSISKFLRQKGAITESQSLKEKNFKDSLLTIKQTGIDTDSMSLREQVALVKKYNLHKGLIPNFRAGVNYDFIKTLISKMSNKSSTQDFLDQSGLSPAMASQIFNKYDSSSTKRQYSKAFVEHLGFEAIKNTGQYKIDPSITTPLKFFNQIKKQKQPKVNDDPQKNKELITPFHNNLDEVALNLGIAEHNKLIDKYKKISGYSEIDWTNAYKKIKTNFKQYENLDDYSKDVGINRLYFDKSRLFTTGADLNQSALKVLTPNQLKDFELKIDAIKNRVPGRQGKQFIKGNSFEKYIVEEAFGRKYSRNSKPFDLENISEQSVNSDLRTLFDVQGPYSHGDTIWSQNEYGHGSPKILKKIINQKLLNLNLFKRSKDKSKTAKPLFQGESSTDKPKTYNFNFGTRVADMIGMPTQKKGKDKSRHTVIEDKNVLRSTNRQEPPVQIKESIGKRIPDGTKISFSYSRDYINVGDDATQILEKIKDGEKIINIKSEMENIARNSSSGYIPNFANPLQSAISREVNAGVPKSLIRVDQDNSLRSEKNPLGLAVINTRDEPAGVKQGIRRAKKIGIDPKTHGASIGHIPNFVNPMRIIGNKTKKLFSGTENQFINLWGTIGNKVSYLINMGIDRLDAIKFSKMNPKNVYKKIKKHSEALRSADISDIEQSTNRYISQIGQPGFVSPFQSSDPEVLKIANKVSQRYGFSGIIPNLANVTLYRGQNKSRTTIDKPTIGKNLPSFSSVKTPEDVVKVIQNFVKSHVSGPLSGSRDIGEIDNTTPSGATSFSTSEMVAKQFAGGGLNKPAQGNILSKTVPEKNIFNKNKLLKILNKGSDPKKGYYPKVQEFQRAMSSGAIQEWAKKNGGIYLNVYGRKNDPSLLKYYKTEYGRKDYDFYNKPMQQIVPESDIGYNPNGTNQISPREQEVMQVFNQGLIPNLAKQKVKEKNLEEELVPNFSRFMKPYKQSFKFDIGGQGSYGRSYVARTLKSKKLFLLSNGYKHFNEYMNRIGKQSPIMKLTNFGGKSGYWANKYESDLKNWAFLPNQEMADAIAKRKQSYDKPNQLSIQKIREGYPINFGDGSSLTITDSHIKDITSKLGQQYLYSQINLDAVRSHAQENNLRKPSVGGTAPQLDLLAATRAIFKLPVDKLRMSNALQVRPKTQSEEKILAEKRKYNQIKWSFTQDKNGNKDWSINGNPESIQKFKQYLKEQGVSNSSIRTLDAAIEDRRNKTQTASTEYKKAKKQIGKVRQKQNAGLAFDAAMKDSDKISTNKVRIKNLASLIRDYNANYANTGLIPNYAETKVVNETMDPGSERDPSQKAIKFYQLRDKNFNLKDYGQDFSDAKSYITTPPENLSEKTSLVEDFKQKGYSDSELKEMKELRSIYHNKGVVKLNDLPVVNRGLIPNYAFLPDKTSAKSKIQAFNSRKNSKSLTTDEFNSLSAAMTSFNSGNAQFTRTALSGQRGIKLTERNFDKVRQFLNSSQFRSLNQLLQNKTKVNLKSQSKLLNLTDVTRGYGQYSDPLYEGTIAANIGLIPNFSPMLKSRGPLDTAIQREIDAGIPKSLVKVDQDNSLRSRLNPLGLAVINSKDEPAGVKQGIRRAKEIGIDPKTHGASSGLIPNFVKEAGRGAIDEGYLKRIDETSKEVASSNQKASDATTDLTGRLFGLTSITYLLEGAFSDVEGTSGQAIKTLTSLVQGASQAALTFEALKSVGPSVTKLGDKLGNKTTGKLGKGIGSLIGSFGRFLPAIGAATAAIGPLVGAVKQFEIFQTGSERMAKAAENAAKNLDALSSASTHLNSIEETRSKLTELNNSADSDSHKSTLERIRLNNVLSKAQTSLAIALSKYDKNLSSEDRKILNSGTFEQKVGVIEKSQAREATSKTMAEQLGSFDSGIHDIDKSTAMGFLSANAFGVGGSVGDMNNYYGSAGVEDGAVGARRAVRYLNKDSQEDVTASASSLSQLMVGATRIDPKLTERMVSDMKALADNFDDDGALKEMRDNLKNVNPPLYDLLMLAKKQGNDAEEVSLLMNLMIPSVRSRLKNEKNIEEQGKVQLAETDRLNAIQQRIISDMEINAKIRSNNLGLEKQIQSNKLRELSHSSKIADSLGFISEKRSVNAQIEEEQQKINNDYNNKLKAANNKALAAQDSLIKESLMSSDSNSFSKLQVTSIDKQGKAISPEDQAAELASKRKEIETNLLAYGREELAAKIMNVKNSTEASIAAADYLDSIEDSAKKAEEIKFLQDQGYIANKKLNGSLDKIAQEKGLSVSQAAAEKGLAEENLKQLRKELEFNKGGLGAAKQKVNAFNKLKDILQDSGGIASEVNKSMEESVKAITITKDMQFEINDAKRKQLASQTYLNSLVDEMTVTMEQELTTELENLAKARARLKAENAQTPEGEKLRGLTKQTIEGRVSNESAGFTKKIRDRNTESFTKFTQDEFGKNFFENAADFNLVDLQESGRELAAQFLADKEAGVHLQETLNKISQEGRDFSKSLRDSQDRLKKGDFGTKGVQSSLSNLASSAGALQASQAKSRELTFDDRKSIDNKTLGGRNPFEVFGEGSTAFDVDAEKALTDLDTEMNNAKDSFRAFSERGVFTQQAITEMGKESLNFKESLIKLRTRLDKGDYGVKALEDIQSRRISNEGVQQATDEKSKIITEERATELGLDKSFIGQTGFEASANVDLSELESSADDLKKQFDSNIESGYYFKEAMIEAGRASTEFSINLAKAKADLEVGGAGRRALEEKEMKGVSLQGDIQAAESLQSNASSDLQYAESTLQLAEARKELNIHEGQASLFADTMAVRIAQANVELARFNETLANTTFDAVEQGFHSFFENISSGTKSIGDAALEFAGGIVGAIHEQFKQKAIKNITASLMSGLNFDQMNKGGLAGYSMGGIVQNYNSGGSVGGGYTPKPIRRYASGGSTQQVPAMLTAGEYVVKKKIVDRLGSEKLNAINESGSLEELYEEQNKDMIDISSESAAPIPSIIRAADGGQVSEYLMKRNMGEDRVSINERSVVDGDQIINDFTNSIEKFTGGIIGGVINRVSGGLVELRQGGSVAANQDKEKPQYFADGGLAKDIGYLAGSYAASDKGDSEEPPEPPEPPKKPVALNTRSKLNIDPTSTQMSSRARAEDSYTKDYGKFLLDYHDWAVEQNNKAVMDKANEIQGIVNQIGEIGMMYGMDKISSAVESSYNEMQNKKGISEARKDLTAENFNRDKAEDLNNPNNSLDKSGLMYTAPMPELELPSYDLDKASQNNASFNVDNFQASKNFDTSNIGNFDSFSNDFEDRLKKQSFSGSKQGKSKYQAGGLVSVVNNTYYNNGGQVNQEPQQFNLGGLAQSNASNYTRTYSHFSSGGSVQKNSNLNNAIYHMSSGGKVRGPAGIDKVGPVMLDKGEYVIKASSVNKVEKQYPGFFDRLNTAKMNQGGEVGKARVDAPQTTPTENNTNNDNSSSNVTININVSSTGETSVSGGSNSQQSLANNIKDAVVGVISKEKRVGGSLRGR